MNAFLDAVGRFCAHHKWWVLIAWVAILGAVVGLRNSFGGDYVNNYTITGSNSSNGLDLLDKNFPAKGGYAGQIVFAVDKGSIADQADVINKSMANLGNLPDVIRSAVVSPFAQPNSPQVAKNGKIAYGAISWSVVTTSLGTGYLDQMNTAVEPATKAGVQVEYGANAGNIGNTTDDKKSEIIGLSCALLLLLFMFASIAAALVPLISAVFSVLTGLSLVGLLAAAITFPTSAPTVATLLGLGVAVDYGLFLMARHREQVDHGIPVVESAGRSTATSGAAIVVAGGTVVVAILGLYVSGVPFVGAMGLAAAIVVAVTMLAALTLMPTFMGVVGNTVKALGELKAERKARASGDQVQAQHDLAARTAAADEAHERSAFARWGRKVSDKPWPWAIGATVVLVILAIPLFSLRLGQLDASSDPTSESIRQAYDLMSEGFGPGSNGPLSVVVQIPKGSSQQATQTLLTNVSGAITKTTDVAAVGPPSLNKNNTIAVMTVVPGTAPEDAQTTTLVNQLRDSVLPQFNTQTYVVGTTAAYVDFTAKISQRMVWLILVVIALAFVLLTVAFRSIIVPLKAAVLNLLSVGAAYGVVVAIFQWGWGSRAVGIDEKLPIPAFVPMLMFAIIFGLSMDYEVFLISRVHESWMKLKDAHRAVAIGIGGTARVITTAALIMIVVFLSFVLDTDPTVKMLAVGMAAAVLIDASVIRMILVPAVMTLLGHHAWYMPRWLDKITPNLDIEGSEHLASLAAMEQVATEKTIIPPPGGPAEDKPESEATPIG
jgi:RND superfamily putative drug exporter